MFLTLSLTIFPSILIAIFVIFSDKFREPVLPIIYSVLLGFFIIVPASFLNNYFIFSNENSDSLIFIAGFTEEPLKFIMLYLFLRKRVEFDEPMDALGFATLENFEYVYLSDGEVSSMTIAAIRAFSAVPLHACCGIIMGYYYGLYIFQGSINLILKSISFPIIIHSSYNYLVNFNDFILFIYIPLLVLYGTYLLDKMGDLQKSKDAEKEVKF
jgi:RsiW-degrading membrane proteinase PrsW (M82 family)